MTVEEIVSVLP